MAQQQPIQDQHFWSHLWEDVVFRVKEPAKHPPFFFYFLVIVVILGGFGIWYPLLESFPATGDAAISLWRTEVVAAYTFYLGITATSVVDLALASRQHRSLFMFVLFCGVISGILAILSAVLVTRKGPIELAVIAVAVGYVGSLFLWWIGNAENPNLRASIAPSAATGGDPLGDLNGSTEHFKT